MAEGVRVTVGPLVAVLGTVVRAGTPGPAHLPEVEELFVRRHTPFSHV